MFPDQDAAPWLAGLETGIALGKLPQLALKTPTLRRFNQIDRRI
jgi:hypothetical protein